MKKTTSLVSAFVLTAVLGLSGCGMTSGSMDPYGNGESEERKQQDQSSGPLVMPGEIEEGKSADDEEAEDSSSGDERILISRDEATDRESRERDGEGTSESRSTDGLIQPEVTDSERAAELAEQGHRAYRSRKLSKAIRKYRKASELDPSKVEYQINLGSLHFNQENYEQAVNYYRNALSINSKSAEAHLYLGASLLRTGDRRTARRHLKEVLELDPGNRKAQQLLNRSER